MGRHRQHKPYRGPLMILQDVRAGIEWMRPGLRSFAMNWIIGHKYDLLDEYLHRKWHSQKCWKKYRKEQYRCARAKATDEAGE